MPPVDTAAPAPVTEPVTVRWAGGGLAPRWAVLGIFLIVGVGAVGVARDFLLPVVSAVVLFLVFMPVMRRARRNGVPRALTALAIVVALIASLFMIFAVMRGPAGQIAQNLPQISRELGHRVRDIVRAMDGIAAAVEGAAAEEGDERAANVPNAPPTPRPAPSASETADTTGGFSLRGLGDTGLFAILLSTPVVIGQILFTAVLLYFLLASGDLVYLKILQCFGTLGGKRAAYLALRRIEAGLGAYFGAIAVINAGLGVAVGLAMWALGMPVPLMFGVLTFVLNFIPYLGAVLGAALIGTVALLWFDSVGQALLVMATFVALTAIEGQIITPMMVSKRMRMNTPVLFVSVAFWAWLWSVMGMLVAVPLMVAIRITAEHVPGLAMIAHVLSGDDTPPPGLTEGEGAELPQMDLLPRR